MLSDLLKMGAEPSKKCTAHSKRTGAPCNNAPVAGLTVCRMHGGATKAAREAARRRLDEAADRLANKLLKIALDDGASEATQLAAIKDALDRAGLSAKTAVEVSVGVKPWEALAEKIVGFATTTRAESRALRGIPDNDYETASATNTSAPSDGEIVEAEIVEDQSTDRDEPCSRHWHANRR
jgi:hypothetical protein